MLPASDNVISNCTTRQHELLLDKQYIKHKPSKERLQKESAVASCGWSPAPHRSLPHDTSPATRGYPLLGTASYDMFELHAGDHVATEMTAHIVPTANKQMKLTLRDWQPQCDENTTSSWNWCSSSPQFAFMSVPIKKVPESWNHTTLVHLWTYTIASVLHLCIQVTDSPCV
jgi:hypothetical protein